MLLLENVKKAYPLPDGGSLPILDIPHFEISEGEEVVLLGESGGGKSTMLQVIAGITRPSSGKVIIDGVDTSRFSESGLDRFRAAKLGYVFQTFNLMEGFTALENVVLGMTFCRGKKDLARANQLLESVGLGHRKNHKPGSMSVGEQQRTAVARSLANRPRLLLADEPTANVDQANQQNIIDLIRENCRAENISLLMVTHSMAVADQFDRLVRLEDINQVAEPTS